MQPAVKLRLPILQSSTRLHLVPSSRATCWISTFAGLAVLLARKGTPLRWPGHSSRREVQPTAIQARMASASTAQHTHLNRLAQEESPYLLQHQHNPVCTWSPTICLLSAAHYSVQQ